MLCRGEALPVQSVRERIQPLRILQRPQEAREGMWSVLPHTEGENQGKQTAQRQNCEK